MNLQTRINLLNSLGNYLKSNDEEWQEIKKKASIKNAWFTENFIDVACSNIAEQFLEHDKLIQWAEHYHIDDNITAKTVGLVMAGNIPLVGFHDFLCIFICGHKQKIKLSQKDDVLLPFLIAKLAEENKEIHDYIITAEMLKNCDAYIATGSNNTSRYFEQYFGKYPNIIRKNRTSVAILSGKETTEELELLSDDIHLFFGLGCRNVSKLFVPADYDFIPLLNAFKKYEWFQDHHKYKNNYDYQLSILLLNNVYYMTSGSTILVEHTGIFSPIGQMYYEYNNLEKDMGEFATENNNIQCIVGKGHVDFGKAQTPDLFSYADGVDTMQFLLAF